MPIYTMHFAKTHLSDLVARAEAGEEVILARGDKPAARLVPVPTLAPRRRPGVLRDPAGGGAGRLGRPLMRLLLDTHAFLWWLADDPALSSVARDAIAEPANRAHVSAATAWEITTEYRIGKLPAAGLVAADVAREIAAEGFAELPVTVRHAQQAGAIPGPHKDPIDRLLIAQALVEAMTLVSNQALFDGYGLQRLW